MIEVNDNTVAVWYAFLPPRTDYLAHLGKREDGKYELTYRFRYYETNDPWDNQDRKSWYSIVVTYEKRHELITAVREVLEALKNLTGEGSKSYELMRGEGTMEQFMDEFLKLPFVHSRMASEKEKETLSKVVPKV